MDETGMFEMMAISMDDAKLYDDSGRLNGKNAVKFQAYYIFGESLNGRSIIGIDTKSILGWMENSSLFHWETRRIVGPKEKIILNCDKGPIYMDSKEKPDSFERFLYIRKEKNSISYIIKTLIEKNTYYIYTCQIRENIMDTLDIFIFVSKSDFERRKNAAVRILKYVQDSQNKLPLNISRDSFITKLNKKINDQNELLSDNTIWKWNNSSGFVPMKLF